MLLLIILPSICLSQADSTTKTTTPQTDTLLHTSTDTLPSYSKADSIIAFAKSHLGTTYNYGSKSPKTGFDCSGFCYYVFTNNNVDVPRTSRSYGKIGYEVPLESAQKGDVLLFRGTDPSSTSIGHIGIVISELGEPLHFIHSSSSKKHYGVTITDYHNSGYPKRFLKVKRIL